MSWTRLLDNHGICDQYWYSEMSEPVPLRETVYLNPIFGQSDGKNLEIWCPREPAQAQDGPGGLVEGFNA